ncbi:unnamed protein product [Linum trigynum]|uniref:RNase H type-1 domain-containing protein n=1 Tax=Linum trigynum TaxID=586398 RepID=A0AAV2FQ11_9ROSI
MEQDGKFRLGSTYTVAADWLSKGDGSGTHATVAPTWKAIWKWDGPNRIRHFLWLAFHDRLMTNCERKRRRICVHDTCELCKAAPESSEHVLRHCVMAAQVWQALGISDSTLTIGLNMTDWMARNLKDSKSGLLFGVAAWYLWKRRNEWIFNNKHQETQTLIQRIQSWTNTIREAQSNEKDIHTLQQRKTSTEVAWIPPNPEWVVVNSDGSVKHPDLLAAAGGLVRDSSGRCLGAFASNLGACTITRAELMGAIQGLRLAWNLGYRKVDLRVDSMVTLGIMNSPGPYEGRYHNLWRQFQSLLHQDWEIRITHIFREGNKAAVFLANKGHSLGLGFHVVDPSDSGLNFWLLYDSMGIAQSRLV